MTTTASPEAVAPPSEPSFEQMARRVDDAARAVAELDAPARGVAEELRAAVEEIHRSGLVTIVRRLRTDPAAREVLFELVDDPVVRLLLSLHGIIRPDPMTEAGRVLVEVRPQLQSHGGDVQLVRVEDGVAYVRLEGACNGCSMSSVTLRNLVEGALVDNVAAITAVEVLPNEPSPALIPLESLRIGRDPGAEGWVKAVHVAEVAHGEVRAMRLTAPGGQETDVIIVNVGERFAAYVNACAHEGLPLDNAMLDVANGTLTCPWHGFCYDATSGECMSAPGAQLEQLPMRVDAGYAWVRIAR